MMLQTVLDRLDMLGLPDSDITALAQVLTLAVIAPDDEKMRMAATLAEKIAGGMSLQDVRAAQDLAELLLTEF